MTPKCSLRTTQIFLTDTLLTRFDFLTFFVETHEISNLHTHTHTRCQKKGVLSGADLIYRYTFILFYLLFGRRHPRAAPRRDFWTSTPYPLREVSSGRAPPPPSNHYGGCGKTKKGQIRKIVKTRFHFGFFWNHSGQAENKRRKNQVFLVFAFNMQNKYHCMRQK